MHLPGSLRHARTNRQPPCAHTASLCWRFPSVLLPLPPLPPSPPLRAVAAVTAPLRRHPFLALCPPQPPPPPPPPAGAARCPLPRGVQRLAARKCVCYALPRRPWAAPAAACPSGNRCRARWPWVALSSSSFLAIRSPPVRYVPLLPAHVREHADYLDALLHPCVSELVELPCARRYQDQSFTPRSPPALQPGSRGSPCVERLIPQVG